MTHRTRFTRGIAFAAAAAASGMALVGCSQMAELQPVAGDAVTSVQIATSDVVQSSVGTAVKTWPVCTTDGDTYTCAGTMMDGQPIASTGTGSPVMLTVTVGGKQIYQGPVSAVIEKAGRQR